MYYDYDTSIKGKTADGEDDLFLNQQIGSYILKGKLLRLISNFFTQLFYSIPHSPVWIEKNKKIYKNKISTLLIIKYFFGKIELQYLV